MSDNNIDNIQDMKDSLNFMHLKHLDLSCNNIGDNAAILCNVHMPRLAFLGFSRNNVSEETCDMLRKFFSDIPMHIS